jgi:hypothetical protein
MLSGRLLASPGSGPAPRGGTGSLAVPIPAGPAAQGTARRPGKAADCHTPDG